MLWALKIIFVLSGRKVFVYDVCIEHTLMTREDVIKLVNTVILITCSMVLANLVMEGSS